MSIYAHAYAHGAPSLYACICIECIDASHVDVSNRRRHFVRYSLFHIILSFNIALILTMPLTRTFSFTALNVLNNLDDAPPVPSSVSCHSQTPAVSLPCKPFVKPPTIPFDRLSFIRRSSPLARSDNFPTLSVLPPPKKLVPNKPRLNLYRNTLISYWHREFSKKYAAKKRAVQGRLIMKHTPKKSITTVASLLVEKAGKGFENAAVQR